MEINKNGHAAVEAVTGLKLCHLNIQGISNKLDLLENMLREEDTDIMCVTEHWLDPSVSDLCIVGYTLISNFARSRFQHGGSLILIKNGIDLPLKPFRAAECLSVEGHCEFSGVIVGECSVLCCYRPPSGNLDVFVDSASSALSAAYTYSKYVIFCGDLNIDSGTSNVGKKLLCDLFNSFMLSITTHDPTRIFTYRNGHTSISTIDYLVTNIPENLYISTVFNPHISDHSAHRFSFNISDETFIDSSTRNKIYGRQLSENSMSLFTNMIMSQQWHIILDFSLNCCELWSQFIEHIMYCLNCCCPYKMKSIKNSSNTNGWYNEELSNIKKMLDKLHWVQKRTNDPNLRLQYRELQKTYRHKVNSTKKSFFLNKINSSENKTKAIWNIVNEKLNRNRKNQSPILLKIDEKIISDPTEVATEFAKHFTTVSSRKLHQIYGNPSSSCTVHPIVSQSIGIVPIGEDEVLKVIKNLRNKNSAGIDDLNVKLIKSIYTFILPPLTYLINRSLDEAVFPQILKTANVVPIYKKNEHENIENYRQISILSIFSKIFERIVYNKIMNYLLKYRILSVAQHGFLQGRSTETASCQFLNYVCKSIDEGKHVVSIFFDLSIAFDTINKEFLISKLYNLGIRGSMLSWIESYMTNRKIIVKYGSVCSAAESMELGVPQGSVLGPLLFLLYVNDLPLNIRTGHVLMYADDTTVVAAADSLEGLSRVATGVCRDMEEWCRRNGLILNLNKTVYMNMYNRRPISSDLEVQHGIEPSNCVKFLGTRIDPQLTFCNHIDHVCAKLNSAYFAILSLKNTLDTGGLLAVYYALAFSHLSNNIVCWGSIGTQCKRIFIIQKRILRLIFNINFRESCKETFISNKILTFPCIYIFNCLKFVNNNRYSLKKLGNAESRTTRGNDLLEVPKHKTRFFENSPLYKCTTIHNKLPIQFRALRGAVFERRVKSFLLEKAFYSVRDFLDHRF